MERKDFLKVTGSIIVLANTTHFTNVLSSCSQLPIFKATVNNNRIEVPVSLFVHTNLQIVRSKQLNYDIALRKENDGNYNALLLCCTHADNGLTSTGKGFVCNLHGSRFNSEGMVTQGPAEISLKKLETKVESDNIIIVLN